MSNNKNTTTHKKSDSKFFGQITQAKPRPPGKTCSRERILFSAIKWKYGKNRDKLISTTVLSKLTEFRNFTVKIYANSLPRKPCPTDCTYCLNFCAHCTDCTKFYAQEEKNVIVKFMNLFNLLSIVVEISSSMIFVVLYFY